MRVTSEFSNLARKSKTLWLLLLQYIRQCLSLTVIRHSLTVLQLLPSLTSGWGNLQGSSLPCTGDLCILSGMRNHILVLRSVCVPPPGMGMSLEFILSCSPASIWALHTLSYPEANWEITAVACVGGATSALLPWLLQRFSAMKASLLSYSWTVVRSTSVLTVFILSVPYTSCP